LQKVIISDPETGKSYSMELEEGKAKAFIGLDIGKVLEGASIGLSGYKLEITGGSDKDGFPMRADVPGRGRQKVFLSKGPGYRPKAKGLKRRKMVRGRTITPDIVQINAKIVKKGKTPLDKLLAPKEQ
jgi:small subunit ribosomal protein S6e